MGRRCDSPSIRQNYEYEVMGIAACAYGPALGVSFVWDFRRILSDLAALRCDLASAVTVERTSNGYVLVPTSCGTANRRVVAQLIRERGISWGVWNVTPHPAGNSHAPIKKRRPPKFGDLFGQC